MEKFKRCKYFLYDCHYEAEEGSKYCSLHGWLMTMVLSLFASAGALFLGLMLMSIYPAHTFAIFIATMVIAGGLIFFGLKS